MKHLDSLLTSSGPGASMHHLHVIAAPAGALGPFGVPEEGELNTKIYAIAPVAEPGERFDVGEFIAKAIVSAAVEAGQENLTVLFAALAQEMWTADPVDDHARRLMREGRLAEHPNAVEVTVVYGACRDGRRWRGRHWLTGPKAGTSEHVDLLVGLPRPHEGYGVDAAPLIRQLVGLDPWP
jgi:hypothetical protein